MSITPTSLLSAQQREMVESLTSMLGAAEGQAIAALERSKWNLEQAADAMLNSEVTASSSSNYAAPSVKHLDLAGDPRLGALNAPPPSPKAHIDLSGDDDAEMAKALQASLGTPSAREQPPGYKSYTDEHKQQNWQMQLAGPRTDIGPTVSHDEAELNRALEASLSSSLVDTGEDAYLALAPHERRRQPGRPVIMRARTWDHALIAQLMRAFASIPQVVEAFKDMNYLDNAMDLEDLKQVQHMLATLESAEEAAVSIHDFSDVPSEDRHPPASRTRDIIDHIMGQVSRYQHLRGGFEHRQLLQTTIGDMNQEADYSDAAAIRINHIATQPDDVITALSKVFHGRHPWRVILAFPHVMAFEISHIAGSGSERHPLKFPAKMYLDRFSSKNAVEATNRIAKARAHHEAIEDLLKRKKTLTELNGRDTLKDLRGSLHYFAEVASDKSNAARKEQIDHARNKLGKIIALVENELESIKAQTNGLEKSNQMLFETEDMQQHLYELRAVLVNDGVQTRSHLWTYFKEGTKWWKANDLELTEVDERTVLEESIGLHMGGGPYMLFYARAKPDPVPEGEATHELEWPTDIAEGLRLRNEEFKSALERAGEQRVAATPMDLS